MIIYSYLMVAQLALFEVCRGNQLVYESRRSVYKIRCKRSGILAPPVRSRWPLAWIGPTLAITEDELLHLVGLDMFVMIRFIKMCWKMCLFATLLCSCLLVPCYIAGDSFQDASYNGESLAHRSIQE